METPPEEINLLRGSLILLQKLRHLSANKNLKIEALMRSTKMEDTPFIRELYHAFCNQALYRETIVEYLEEECSTASPDSPDDLTPLIIGQLLLCVEDEILETPKVREFAIQSGMNASHRSLRINITHILHRLARRGDSEALSVLKKLSTNVYVRVKENAQYMLAELAQETD
ncbi:MAG: hypothetical protein WDZ88_04350 [Candidatus Paceibacterota bacterium]